MKIIGPIIIWAAVAVFSTAAQAQEFNKGDELLKQMNKELRGDRVASRQDRRMNNIKAGIRVSWDINADFEITSKAKYELMIDNKGVSYAAFQQLRETL